jgi:hypothetical protein
MLNQPQFIHDAKGFWNSITGLAIISRPDPLLLMLLHLLLLL